LLKVDKYTTFDEFCVSLRVLGFLPGSFPWSDGGIFSVRDFVTDRVTWHNDDPETDPWLWRRRVLGDCSDIAYSKLFQNKTGYITREWYPLFLAARRRGRSLNDEYRDGKISQLTKRIYDLVAEYPALAVHDIKSMGNFSSEKKSKFDRALVELQMKMYITTCGEAQKLSKLGEPYGWAGAVFCTADGFFSGAWEQSLEIAPELAAAKIAERIREIVPSATDKECAAIIGG